MKVVYWSHAAQRAALNGNQDPFKDFKTNVPLLGPEGDLLRSFITARISAQVLPFWYNQAWNNNKQQTIQETNTEHFHQSSLWLMSELEKEVTRSVAEAWLTREVSQPHWWRISRIWLSKGKRPPGGEKGALSNCGTWNTLLLHWKGFLCLMWMVYHLFNTNI